MASKYHVNPNSGIPDLCSAANGTCPFGGEAIHGTSPADAVARFERRVAQATARSGPAGTSPSGPGTSTFHSDPVRVDEACNGPASQAPVKTYLSFRAPSQVNPTTGEGEAYGHYAQGVAIVGKPDGTRVRVMAGPGFTVNGNLVGQRISLHKRQARGEAATRGLVVLGCVDEDGNRHGYVPNRKFQYFVLC